MAQQVSYIFRWQEPSIRSLPLFTVTLEREVAPLYYYHYYYFYLSLVEFSSHRKRVTKRTSLGTFQMAEEDANVAITYNGKVTLKRNDCHAYSNWSLSVFLRHLFFSANAQDLSVVSPENILNMSINIWNL